MDCQETHFFIMTSFRLGGDHTEEELEILLFEELQAVKSFWKYFMWETVFHRQKTELY